MRIVATNRVRLAILFCTIAAAGTAFAISSDFKYTGTIPLYDPIGGPASVEVFELTLQPGDALPWHFHPGAAFVVVQQGTITEQHACKRPRNWSEGAAFQELPNEIHQVMNNGKKPVKLYVTLIYPKFADSDTVLLTTPPKCD
jgi:quercetin dioxygenase-like cupin family protein